MSRVAWNSNLYSVRFSDHVWELTGTDAEQAIADVVNWGAKVVSLAWSATFNHEEIRDRITNSYYNLGVVFVGAAGTTPADLSQNNVLFPASIQEVVAVSAADFDGQRDNQSHYGPELDVVAFHQTTTVGATSGSLSLSSNSSNATGLVTGVVALMRSRYPTWTPSQIVAQLKATAGIACGGASEFGPIINAEAAVGGLCVYRGSPVGNDVVSFTSWTDPETRYESYSVTVSGGTGPYQIQWSNGAVGPNSTFSFGRGNYVVYVTATITDLGSGVTPLVVRRPVYVIDTCDEGDPQEVDECP